LKSGRIGQAGEVTGQAVERPVQDEVLEPEQGRQTALVASEGRGELAEIRVDGVLAGTDGALVVGKPQRVVADRILQTEHHRRVLPCAAETQDLDARMLSAGVALRQFLLQELEPLQLFRRKLLKHRIALRRFRVEGRCSVAPDQLSGGEGDEDRSRSHPPGARRVGPGGQRHGRRGDEKPDPDLAHGGRHLTGLRRERDGGGDPHDGEAGRDQREQKAFGREAGYPIRHVAVDEVAGCEGERDIDEEGGVRRPAIQVHAGNVIEHQLESGRVPAERVKQGQHAEDQEEAELAGEEAAAADSVPEHEERRDGPDEEVVDRPVRPGALGEAVPVRSPVIVGPAQRPEDVPEQEGRQALGRQRAHGGDTEAEGRPCRRHQELHGENGRDREQRAADHGHGQEESRARSEVGQALLGSPGAMKNHPDERESAEECDLIPAHGHQCGGDRKGGTDAIGAAVECGFEQPQTQGEQAVAEDDARMLQARGGRSAQHENDGGGDRTGRMPAATPEERHEG
jgi:hypothetical protein